MSHTGNLYVPKRYWQDPNETKRYRWNFSAWCTVAGTSLVSADILLPSGSPLEIVGSVVVGSNIVTAYIRGLVSGAQYTVTCRATTAEATPQVLDRSIILIARDF